MGNIVVAVVGSVGVAAVADNIVEIDRKNHRLAVEANRHLVEENNDLDSCCSESEKSLGGKQFEKNIVEMESDVGRRRIESEID